MKKWRLFMWTVAATLPAWTAVARAEDALGAVPAAGLQSGDIAWMLAASALVTGMIVPGLAFYYGGLVRSKNVISTMVQSFGILCVVSLIWILFGYSLAFAPDRGGVVGGLEWMLLSGVGASPNPMYAPTIPHQAFMLFELLFAAFTPALIAGAFAERIKFGSMLLFAGLWSAVVYAPLAHWLWGGGWLMKLGAVDFAGGAVVHVSAGFSAVACAMAVGKRRGWRTDYMAPHNLPFILLGAGMLWLGWFGFNGGSARGANAVSVNAIVVTHLTAVSAAMSWMVAEWKHRGKPTVLGIASGAIAGLATSTAGAGFVGPLAGVALGIAAGLCSYLAIVWKGKIGYDDTLDVMGTHGVGGILGMLGVGLFAANGHLAVQLVAVVASGAYSFIGSYALLKLVDGAGGLRVTPEEESTGLDLTQHNERAYS
ncbi:Ammonium transporter NrgA [Nitrospira japonica]|uniref:Ammonium transporter n=1 Tax=Nitrospira japonica TaxID=1325564 RepID=A0A1W1I6L5_9BACT|nr:ammonium transporter [Nitrospira japonica]SLM48571.1 Ammonium transporter NrgA [Nitrospira japonica]